MLNSNKIEEIGIIIAQMSQDLEALKLDEKINSSRWEELIMASESIRCKINSLYLDQIDHSINELKRAMKELPELETPVVPIFVEESKTQEPADCNAHEFDKHIVAEEEEEEFELFYDSNESILDMSMGKGPAWMIDNPGPHIADISDGITLNDKISFINDLFNGDAQQYRLSVQKINEMKHLDEVLDYTRTAFPDWDEESNTTYRFYMIVRRRVNG